MEHIEKQIKKTLEWAEKQQATEPPDESVKEAEPEDESNQVVEPEVMDVDDVLPGQGIGGIPLVFTNKGGRPSKYFEAYDEQAKVLCSKGFIDIDLAEFFKVAVSTVYLWKKEQPSFSEAIKQGKELMDAQVEKALIHRALGYSVKEEKVFCHEGDITTHEVVKHLPPDPTSMIFWLKNRKPKVWRDKHEVDINTPQPVVMSVEDQGTL